MTLLDRIAALWERLEPAGWGAVLAAHGLKIPRKIAPAKLARLLTAPLKVDRNQPGFGEFAAGGARGVEPGRPARSLLYYALASPLVRAHAGGRVEAFATPAEIETVENYVFAAREWSLDDVRTAAADLAGSPRPALAVVVYASEFRPAAGTPHRRHADLCFARTGVARAGITDPHYDPAERGFVYRRDDDDPAAIRVGPVRYSAWVAVALRGSAERFLPMDHNAMRDYAADYRPPFIPESRYKTLFPPQPGDDSRRSFWVPLHKLFGGAECLRSGGGQPLPLTVRLTARHVNDKLAKLFAYLQAPIDPDRLARPPYAETAGLAEFSTAADHGDGLLVPVAHPHLVAPATDGDRFLTIPVPPDASLRQLGALKTPQVPGPRGEYRTAPGYAHIRHELRDGTVIDLNGAFPNPLDLLEYLTAGNYRAVAYRDFTADGWVEAGVPELAADVPERRAAYSVVAPPDFFPRVDQRRLMELQGEIDRAWFVPPLALSDVRVPVNVRLEGSGFDPTDTTATAIVGLPDVAPDGSGPVAGPLPDSPRHTALPDDAAGVFHPGWDVGLTYNGVYEYLTNHTLGSPFPEDVKLCAAISSYWPGVVPDAARVFPPIAPRPPAAGPEAETEQPTDAKQQTADAKPATVPPAADPSTDLVVLPLLPTIIPMTDREIGMRPGTTAWDGSPPPRLVTDQEQHAVEYVSPIHADYVSQSLARGFSLVETAKLDFAGYRARVLAMQGVYRGVGVPPGPPPADDKTPDPRAFWLVYSFREAEPADFESAKFAGSRDRVFYVALFRHGPVRPVPGRPLRFRVAVRDNVMRRFLASDSTVIELK